MDVLLHDPRGDRLALRHLLLLLCKMRLDRAELRLDKDALALCALRRLEDPPVLLGMGHTLGIDARGRPRRVRRAERLQRVGLTLAWVEDEGGGCELPHVLLAARDSRAGR